MDEVGAVDAVDAVAGASNRRLPGLRAMRIRCREGMVNIPWNQS